jgi:hypothetical protein
MIQEIDTQACATTFCGADWQSAADCQSANCRVCIGTAAQDNRRQTGANNHPAISAESPIGGKSTASSNPATFTDRIAAQSVRYSITALNFRSDTAMWIVLAFAALAYQPDAATLRRIYEENLARREREYGAEDLRTAQAARDLGFFLERAGDTTGARRALARVVAIDEKAIGPTASQTLEDDASLATVSPAAEARPLLAHAAESPDPSVAGPALSTLAGMRKAVGDRAGAAELYRRALDKAVEADGKESPIVALLLKALLPLVGPKEAAELQARYGNAKGR